MSVYVVGGIVCHTDFPTRTEALILPGSETVGNQLDSFESIFKTVFRRHEPYSRSHYLPRGYSHSMPGWLMHTHKVLAPILQFRTTLKVNSDSRDTHGIC